MPGALPPFPKPKPAAPSSGWMPAPTKSVAKPALDLNVPRGKTKGSEDEAETELDREGDREGERKGERDLDRELTMVDDDDEDTDDFSDSSEEQENDAPPEKATLSKKPIVAKAGAAAAAIPEALKNPNEGKKKCALCGAWFKSLQHHYARSFHDPVVFAQMQAKHDPTKKDMPRSQSFVSQPHFKKAMDAYIAGLRRKAEGTPLPVRVTDVERKLSATRTRVGQLEENLGKKDHRVVKLDAFVKAQVAVNTSTKSRHDGLDYRIASIEDRLKRYTGRLNDIEAKGVRFKDLEAENKRLKKDVLKVEERLGALEVWKASMPALWRAFEKKMESVADAKPAEVTGASIQVRDSSNKSKVKISVVVDRKRLRDMLE